MTLEKPTQKVVSIGLGIVFFVIAMILWGTTITQSFAVGSFLLFGAAILFFEVGMKSWVDGEWNAIEIASGVIIVAVVGFAAYVMLSGNVATPNNLIGNLMPWVMIILGADIILQGYRL